MAILRSRDADVRERIIVNKVGFMGGNGNRVYGALSRVKMNGPQIRVIWYEGDFRVTPKKTREINL